MFVDELLRVAHVGDLVRHALHEFLKRTLLVVVAGVPQQIRLIRPSVRVDLVEPRGVQTRAGVTHHREHLVLLAVGFELRRKRGIFERAVLGHGEVRVPAVGLDVLLDAFERVDARVEPGHVRRHRGRRRLRDVAVRQVVARGQQHAVVAAAERGRATRGVRGGHGGGVARAAAPGAELDHPRKRRARAGRVRGDRAAARQRPDRGEPGAASGNVAISKRCYTRRSEANALARALAVEQWRALRRIAGGRLPRHRDTTRRQRLERLKRAEVRLGVSDAAPDVGSFPDVAKSPGVCRTLKEIRKTE